MKKVFKPMLVVFVLLSVVLVGCVQKPQAANAAEAIDQANQIESVEAKVQYLVKEANGFVNSKQFDQAVETAKYVLANLDKESKDAQSILDKAQAELKKLAEEKMAEVKGALGSLGQ